MPPKVSQLLTRVLAREHDGDGSSNSSSSEDDYGLQQMAKNASPGMRMGEKDEQHQDKEGGGGRGVERGRKHLPERVRVRALKHISKNAQGKACERAPQRWRLDSVGVAMLLLSSTELGHCYWVLLPMHASCSIFQGRWCHPPTYT